MLYNLYIKTASKPIYLIGIKDSQLNKAIAAYRNGYRDFTLSGIKHNIDGIIAFKIFSYKSSKPIEDFKKYFREQKTFYGQRFKHFGLDLFRKVGKDVTHDMIGDCEYGELSQKRIEETSNDIPLFVNHTRIEQLRHLNLAHLDFARLIKLCEEINDNYLRGNYLSVSMIGRTILNHVPPVFEKDTFDQVASNYGGKSFKNSMQHLNKSLKNIADSHLHQPIRKKESLPNETQVDFKQDLDVLLAEIIRFLK